MKFNRIAFLAAIALSLFSILIAGCATKISRPTEAPKPSRIRFATFKNVEMKTITIAPEYASADANQRAAKKIEEYLVSDMRMLFPNLRIIDADNDFTTTKGRTLRIEPIVKEIKFIGGGARFMVGAMAGSSAVLMQTIFRDSATNEIIADPTFLRIANAHAGGWSIGATDNKMLEEIAQDFAHYTSLNK